MTKRQLIDEIVSINQSAAPAFLAEFNDADLEDYLRHLHWMQMPRMTGQSQRYATNFRGVSGEAAGVECSRDLHTEPPSLFSADTGDRAMRDDSAAATDETHIEPSHAVTVSASSSSGNEDMPFANGQEESESWLF